jgi:site-specific DNA-cytosine methylase
MKLTSVDLFSGVGGLTLALDDIARPVAYCDIDEDSQKVLISNMSTKCTKSTTKTTTKSRIHAAPICGDIKSFGSSWLRANGVDPRRVQALVAGFPCTGFSTGGIMAGFDDVQSRLFFEMLRVIDEIRPGVLFLENVPQILDRGMDDVVRELHGKRGYDLYWCLLRARDVGAPHKRKRWFCLASMSGTRIPRIPTRQSDARSWAKEPPRTDCGPEFSRKRVRLLGNAVVPQCARAAFRHLIDVQNQKENQTGRTTNDELSRIKKSHVWPSHGCVILVKNRESRTGDIRAPECPLKKSPLMLRLRADAYRSNVKANNELPPIRGSVVVNYWATPRRSGSWASQVLTARSKGDLGTQIRFAESTPVAQRGCNMSAGFVEWLMGYPLGWTREVG